MPGQPPLLLELHITTIISFTVNKLHVSHTTNMTTERSPSTTFRLDAPWFANNFTVVPEVKHRCLRDYSIVAEPARILLEQQPLSETGCERHSVH